MSDEHRQRDVIADAWTRRSPAELGISAASVPVTARKACCAGWPSLRAHRRGRGGSAPHRARPGAGAGRRRSGSTAGRRGADGHQHPGRDRQGAASGPALAGDRRPGRGAAPPRGRTGARRATCCSALDDTAAAGPARPRAGGRRAAAGPGRGGVPGRRAGRDRARALPSSSRRQGIASRPARWTGSPASATAPGRACRAARATLEQARAQERLARAELALTRAPRPLRRRRRRGQHRAGGVDHALAARLRPPTGHGPPRPDSLYVAAPIDEMDAERVQVGQEVRLTVDSRRGRGVRRASWCGSRPTCSTWWSRTAPWRSRPSSTTRQPCIGLLPGHLGRRRGDPRADAKTCCSIPTGAIAQGDNGAGRRWTGGSRSAQSPPGLGNWQYHRDRRRALARATWW